MRTIAIITLVLAGCGSSPHGHDQVGRYQALPKQVGEPQLILDTSTGCVFRPGAVSAGDIKDEHVPKCISTSEIYAAAGFKVIRYDAQGNRLPESGGATSTDSAADKK